MLRYFIYRIQSETVLVPSSDYYNPKNTSELESVTMQYHSDYDSHEAAIKYLNEHSDNMCGDYAIIPVFRM